LTLRTNLKLPEMRICLITLFYSIFFTTCLLAQENKDSLFVEKIDSLSFSDNNSTSRLGIQVSCLDISDAKIKVKHPVISDNDLKAEKGFIHLKFSKKFSFQVGSDILYNKDEIKIDIENFDSQEIIVFNEGVLDCHRVFIVSFDYSKKKSSDINAEFGYIVYGCSNSKRSLKYVRPDNIRGFWGLDYNANGTRNGSEPYTTFGSWIDVSPTYEGYKVPLMVDIGGWRPDDSSPKCITPCNGTSFPIGNFSDNYINKSIPDRDLESCGSGGGCSNVTSAGSISGGATYCGTTNPGNIWNGSSASGGSGSLTYRWE